MYLIIDETMCTYKTELLDSEIVAAVVAGTAFVFRYENGIPEQLDEDGKTWISVDDYDNELSGDYDDDAD